MEPSTSNADQEKSSLRQELSKLSFEQVLKLKEKMGVKAFNDVFADPSTQAATSTSKEFKRANKNRPREVSSKHRIGVYREVFTVKQQATSRDPRFDALSGEFREEAFKKQYAFIDELRNEEKKALEKQLKESKDDAEQREKIKYILTRMEQQELADKQKEARRDRVRQLRETQKETSKKPVYLRRADQKLLDLADKYRELKRQGKVEQFLAKRRKRLAGREKKTMVVQKRREGKEKE